ncbi:MAG: cell division protein ZapE, partial [Pseudomonadota bacterium]
RRVHFNDFMQDAQERIHSHREGFKAGKVDEEDPIPVVGKALAEEASVLCFDEFTVTDIADAMILGRLFGVLFEEGVVVVATSNVVPENLYRDGLNRKIFLPFIDTLIANVDVYELEARTDFRLEKLNRAEVYLHPVTDANALAFEGAWRDMVGDAKPKTVMLELKGREWELANTGSGAVRLEFSTLCEQPRSAEDYIALARKFHTIFIEKIPVMDRENHNAAKRFILLIDTLYDSHTRVVVLADAAPDGLYTGKSGTEAFEFARTISRLNEMQSVEYISGSAV